MADRHWKDFNVNERIKEEWTEDCTMTRNDAFSPEKLGLVTLVNTRGGNGGDDRNYLIYTDKVKQTNGKKDCQLKLSMGDRASRLAADLLGTRCMVSFDPESKDIYLWPGNEFAISDCGGKKPGTKRRKSISLKSLLPMYLESFGTTRKVYYDAETQYGGSVVRLKMISSD